jgi:hypothetical protein
MFARASMVLVLTISLAPLTGAQARRRVEIAPALGAYAPMLDLPDVGLVGCFDFPCSHPNRQKLSVAVGGRVTSWLSNRGAIEGSFWYAPSGVSGDYSNTSGNIVMAGLRLGLNLVPRAPAMSVLLMGGPALVQRSGDFYDGLRGRTSFGGALGIGLYTHPGRRFGFRAAIEDYLSSARFGYTPPTGYPLRNYPPGPRKLQQDLVLSLSIDPFGQRGESR